MIPCGLALLYAEPILQAESRPAPELQLGEGTLETRLLCLDDLMAAGKPPSGIGKAISTSPSPRR